jgi:hypothetical protein
MASFAKAGIRYFTIKTSIYFRILRLIITLITTQIANNTSVTFPLIKMLVYHGNDVIAYKSG